MVIIHFRYGFIFSFSNNAVRKINESVRARVFQIVLIGVIKLRIYILFSKVGKCVGSIRKTKKKFKY